MCVWCFEPLETHLGVYHIVGLQNVLVHVFYYGAQIIRFSFVSCMLRLDSQSLKTCVSW